MQHGEQERRPAGEVSRAESDHDAGTEPSRGDPITIGNEFSEVRISRVETRNGARLLIESRKSGRSVALCPLEVEALTWQGTATFSAMIGKPFSPLFEDEP